MLKKEFNYLRAIIQNGNQPLIQIIIKFNVDRNFTYNSKISKNLRLTHFITLRVYTGQ